MHGIEWLCALINDEENRPAEGDLIYSCMI
jgi:hypothetical protein